MPVKEQEGHFTVKQVESIAEATAVAVLKREKDEGKFKGVWQVYAAIAAVLTGLFMGTAWLNEKITERPTKQEVKEIVAAQLIHHENRMLKETFIPINDQLNKLLFQRGANTVQLPSIQNLLNQKQAEIDSLKAELVNRMTIK